MAERRGPARLRRLAPWRGRREGARLSPGLRGSRELRRRSLGGQGGGATRAKRPAPLPQRRAARGPLRPVSARLWDGSRHKPARYPREAFPSVRGNTVAGAAGPRGARRARAGRPAARWQRPVRFADGRAWNGSGGPRRKGRAPQTRGESTERNRRVAFASVSERFCAKAGAGHLSR